MSGFVALTRWRVVVLGAVLCTGLGAGGMWAAQAEASGGPTAAPTVQPRPGHAPLVSRATLGLTPNAAATNAFCGETVTASLTLNGDLSCNGPGLIVTASNVNVNLGGHVIYNLTVEDNATGVEVAGTTDTVQNGVVTGFTDGVHVAPSGTADTVLNLRAEGNGYGIFDSGTGTKITTSVAAQNGFIGIYANGAGGTYSGDREISNSQNGLFASNVLNLVVTSNIADDNGFAGLAIYSPNQVTMTKNTANFNGGDGIDANDLLVIDGGGNTAKGNDYNTGVTPQECLGIACS